MLGNPWHAAMDGMQDLERRRELALRARILRQARGLKPDAIARIRAWLGDQLIRAGKALQQVELVDQTRAAGSQVITDELWHTYPSWV